MAEQSDTEKTWRELLTGKHSALYRGRRMFKMIPSSPRCKMCNAPFAGIGAPITRVMGRRPSTTNPRYCSICEEFARTHPGGTEIELTMLFADIRGSTALAESLGTAAFSRLIDRFFRAVVDVLVDEDALVSRLIGDEAVAFFLPAFISAGHARAAVRAAQTLLRATGHTDPSGPWAPLGIGINTGTAFVGTVGGPGNVVDFTALGDEVNTTARLASLAAAGEILFTEATRVAADLAPEGLESRHLTVKGRAEPVDVWVTQVGEPDPETQAHQAQKVSEGL